MGCVLRNMGILIYVHCVSNWYFRQTRQVKLSNKSSAEDGEVLCFNVELTVNTYSGF